MGGKLGTDSLGQFKLGGALGVAVFKACVALSVYPQAVVFLLPQPSAALELSAVECD